MYNIMLKKTVAILKSLLLWVIILFMVLVLLQGIKFLLPIIISVLKLSSVPIVDVKAHTALEATLNSANFSLVYITILFTAMGIIVTVMSIWWNVKLSSLEKCQRHYEKFRENFPLEMRLTTAKIFFIQGKYSEAWDYIKDLPENFSYEITLYKAGILIKQPHEKSVFSSAMSLLNKALLFPNLSKESKAIIYRYIAITYFEEKDDYGKTLEFAEKAIKENPVFWSAHIVKGRALKRMKPPKLDEAIETLEMIIAEDKTYETAYYNLACYYSLKAGKEDDSKRQLKLKKTAIDHYKASVKLNAKNEEEARTDSDLDFIKSDILD